MNVASIQSHISSIIAQIKSNGEVLTATMPTKALSAPERLVLQAGAMLKVRVSEVDDRRGIVVDLAGRDAASASASTSTGSSRAQGSRSFKSPRNEDISVRVISADTLGDGELMHDADLSTTAATPNNAKVATASALAPPAHLMLNNLKTGMQLQGTVATSTPYAAFINAGEG